jgi:hypothetical protein
MTQIFLTEEQMKVVRQAPAPVQVCDPQGKVLATFGPELSPEFVAEVKRQAAKSKRCYTGEQVRRHLRALEEAWERDGGFDAKRMREILEEIRAKEIGDDC